MTTLYLDCSAGLAGDMLLAALLDLGADRAVLDALIARMGVPAKVVVGDVTRAAMAARHVTVEFPDEHAHRHLSDIEALITRAALPARADARARQTFRALAVAEAAVHGTTVDEVHFHEVGAVDAIVDIVGAAALLEALDVDRVVASPVRTGFGRVRAAHGEMSIPAPATARLLFGVPCFGGDVEGEALTPTGAALLKTLVDAWGALPAGVPQRTGTGAGTRDPRTLANVVRATLVDERGARAPEGLVEERIGELECHVDDMSGEALGFLTETLLAHGALDVVTIPVVGKKSRPAHLVRVLVAPSDVDRALALLFRHSTTLGARVRDERRVRLPRRDVVVETPWGPVPAKAVERAGRARVFPEYDALAAMARAHGLPLDEVERAVARAVDAGTFAPAHRDG